MKNTITKCMFLLSVLLILSLVGCASIPQARYHSHQFRPYNETGIASFYGHHDGFNGNRMANGEKFDASNPHLAAHPSLPLGTKLKVTNLKNNKVLYVEVTDRMGHVKGRIIDLSYGASKYFNMRGSGLVKVNIKSVTDSEFKNHI